jgi:hypothetical protein
MFKAGEEALKIPSSRIFFRFSSWYKFPFHDTDFGRGKPMW